MAIQRVRFSLEEELALLRDVCAENPYACPRKWHEIARRLCEGSNKCFTGRNARDHTDHILKLWSKNDRANLFRSGSEEERVEKKKLLQEAFELAREFKGKKKNISYLAQGGIEARSNGTQEYTFVNVGDPIENFHHHEVSFTTESADARPLELDVLEGTHVENNCEVLSQSHNEKSEVMKGTTLWYLFEKQKQNNVLEKQKLELREKELKLEEEKWEWKKREEKERWELEKKEREERLALEREKQEMEKKEREERWALEREKQEIEKKEREERLTSERETMDRRLKLEEVMVNILSSQQNLIIEFLNTIKK